jgi:hypothetical protein
MPNIGVSLWRRILSRGQRRRRVPQRSVGARGSAIANGEEPITDQTVSVDSVIRVGSYLVGSSCLLSIAATVLTGAIIIQPLLSIALLISSVGFYCMTWMPGWAVSRRNSLKPGDVISTAVVTMSDGSQFAGTLTTSSESGFFYREKQENLKQHVTSSDEKELSVVVPVGSLIRGSSYFVGSISMMSIVATILSNSVIIQPMLAIALLIASAGFYFMVFVKE